MDKETLIKMLEQATENTKKFRSSLFNAAMENGKNQQELMDAILSAHGRDIIQGSNKEKRDAWLRDNFASLYELAYLSERAEAAAKHNYDQAKLDLDLVKGYIAIGIGQVE